MQYQYLAMQNLPTKSVAFNEELLGDNFLVDLATDGASISKPLRIHNPI